MTISLSGMTLLTNSDNEAGFAGTDGPDTYNKLEQGLNSESWNVAKNATETATLTKSAAMPTSRGLFMFWMASDLSFYYTSIDLELQSSTNNFKNFEAANASNKEIGGNFVPSVVDYVNKGTPTGTFDPASLTVSRIIVDNSASGNIRAVINNWIDAIYYGAGLTISGTTTANQLFTEAFNENFLTANKYGILLKKGSVIFSQGDLTLSGTSLVSNGETLNFLATLNGFDVYNLDITGSVALTNTSIVADAGVLFNFDSTTATSFSMTGGVLKRFNTLLTAASQPMSGVVFQDGGASTVANTISDSPFNQCGKITVTGLLSKCTINKSTATEAVSADNTNKADGCSFIKDAAPSHAFELTGAEASYNWNSHATGYDAGATGNSVQVAGASVTGNETIHITATTGTFTINVADGATVPSVSSAGAVVNVVAGQKILTIKGWVSGSQLIIYDDDSADPQELGTELQRNNNVTANESFTYDPAKIGDDIVIVMIPPTSAYKTIQDTVTLGGSDADYTLKPIQETN